MEFHKLEMQGPIYIDGKTGGLPAWGASDEGRLLYDEDNDALAFGGAGSNNTWIQTGWELNTKAWFYQDTAPDGWVIDDTVKDCLIAVRPTNYGFKATGTSEPYGNTYILADSTKDFDSLGVSEGDTVWNVTTSEVARVTYVRPSGWATDHLLTVDGSIFPIGGGQSYTVGSAYVNQVGSLAGTWTTPDHRLDKSEVPEHEHQIAYRNQIWNRKQDSGGSQHQGWTDVYTTDTEDGGTEGLSNSPFHNHGAGHRPYAAVGIVARKNN